MGVDPITLGLGATLVGGAVGAIGKHKERQQQQNTINQRTQGIQGLMQPNVDPYQQQIMQLLGGMKPPGNVDPNSGAIDIGSFLNQTNTGQDALMQFLRADPSKQTPFDASSAFEMLKSNDARQQQGALEALNANFGSSIGSRFGSAARKSSSDLLANIAGQIGTRNAGIAQSSYESAANRSLQGQGLNLQAAMGLNQNTGVLAQLLMANQQNQAGNRNYNLGAQGQFFGQQLQGLEGAAGLRNQNNQYNAMLQQLIAGMPMVQGNAFGDVGGLIGQAGQAASFLPLLRGMSGPAAGQGGLGTRIPLNIPQLQMPSIFNPGGFGQGFVQAANPLQGVLY